VARHRNKRERAYLIDERVRREFEWRGLFPPFCTPEALARALEAERHIAIEFREHASNDPGVYGLVYRKEGNEDVYVILYRSTHSLALRRLVQFHELAHILFRHELMEVGGVAGLRGYMVSDADDAEAEAFAVGAMQYSFINDETTLTPNGDDDVPESVFGQLLKRIRYVP